MRLRFASLLVATCAALTSSTVAAAQEASAAARVRRNIVSVNPFLPLAGYFQGEYERQLRENLAFAVSGSHVKLDETYTSGDVKLRFYPQERGLHGLGIAAGLGVGRLREESFYDDFFCPDIPGVACPATRRARVTAPSFSVEMHYQWLLGRSRSTAVAIGAGAKRFYVDNRRDETFQEFVPTLRLTIGYAFR